MSVVDTCKALLSAIGVGEKSATVIGATFQVVIDDILSSPNFYHVNLCHIGNLAQTTLLF